MGDRRQELFQECVPNHFGFWNLHPGWRTDGQLVDNLLVWFYPSFELLDAA